MRRPAVFIAIAFSLLFASVPARAFEAQVIPAEALQGDPFLIRVFSNPAEPSAEAWDGQLPFSTCGPGCYVAVGAVELESEPGLHEIRVSAGGMEKILYLNVKDGNFPVQHLTLPEDKVTLGPEDSKRAEAEAERLKALWPRSSERLWEGGFILPLKNSLSTVFGAGRVLNGKKKSPHSGIDIRGRRGEEIKAANAGRVVLAEELFYGGNTVVLDHGSAIYTVYMHLSEIKVRLNEVVQKGQTVGLVGSTGRSTGPHLHYGVKINGLNANPLKVAELPL